MLKVRTKLLLVTIFLLGIGIGVLSGWSDGMYSAICLFFLPIFVALAGAAIIADFGSPEPTEERVAPQVKLTSRPAETAIGVKQRA